MKLDIRYFAWLRERVGTASETVETDAVTVAALISELRARDEGYALAFSDTGAIRAAIDHDLVDMDAPLAGAKRGRVLSADDGGLNR